MKDELSGFNRLGKTIVRLPLIKPRKPSKSRNLFLDFDENDGEEFEQERGSDAADEQEIS